MRELRYRQRDPRAGRAAALHGSRTETATALSALSPLGGGRAVIQRRQPGATHIARDARAVRHCARGGGRRGRRAARDALLGAACRAAARYADPWGTFSVGCTRRPAGGRLGHAAAGVRIADVRLGSRCELGRRGARARRRVAIGRRAGRLAPVEIRCRTRAWPIDCVRQTGTAGDSRVSRLSGADSEGSRHRLIPRCAVSGTCTEAPGGTCRRSRGPAPSSGVDGPSPRIAPNSARDRAAGRHRA